MAVIPMVIPTKPAFGYHGDLEVFRLPVLLEHIMT